MNIENDFSSLLKRRHLSRMPTVRRQSAGKAPTKATSKKKAKSYVIDCSKPVNDKIMDIASFEKFLIEHIKVDGKVGMLSIPCLLLSSLARYCYE